MCEWWDDPVFTNMQETFDGTVLRGNEWCKFMQVKERRPKAKVISVKGVSFRSEALRSAVQKGSKTVPLEAEPDNEHDRNAIKVNVGKSHCGYVPRGTDVSPDAKAHLLKWSATPPQLPIAVDDGA